VTTAASWPSRLVGSGRNASRLYRASTIWAWSFVAMAVSSVTSFTLSLLSGRTLGASGLGIVFAGFTGYVMLLTFHRALVTTPLISSSSALTDADRRHATSVAFVMSIAMGAACGVLVALAGIAVGGGIGTGLLVFAPWFIPAFAQDLFRSSLVRDGRARRAAVADLCWLCTLVLGSLAALEIDAAWAVVASWGLGSAVAAAIGYLSIRPSSVAAVVAWRWFRTKAFPFGRWLVGQEGVFVLGFFGLYLSLAALLGVDDLGGLRAAESVFAPFTLLAPALTLAGLPALSRAASESHRLATRRAVLVSATGVVFTLAYAGLMLLVGPSLLTSLFGADFDPYTGLLVPMSVGQVALAAGLGFGILLKAEQRGGEVLLSGVVFVTASLVASLSLATQDGIEGAVWGLSAGAAVLAALVICLGVRPPRAVPS
jgi:O-antigen/teichoic acid export membrane protein